MPSSKCTVCNIKKDTSDGYYWSKGKRQERCKECQRMMVRIWQKHHREQVLNYKRTYNRKKSAEHHSQHAASSTSQAPGQSDQREENPVQPE
jgi:hypothetical protein